MKIKDKIRKLLIYDKVRYGCGSGIFYNKRERTHYEACKTHDILYEEGELDRKEIDSIFLQDMLHASKGNIWHKIRAYIYYGIVRLVGGYFYKKR